MNAQIQLSLIKISIVYEVLLLRRSNLNVVRFCYLVPTLNLLYAKFRKSKFIRFHYYLSGSIIIYPVPLLSIRFHYKNLETFLFFSKPRKEERCLKTFKILIFSEIYLILRDWRLFRPCVCCICPFTNYQCRFHF